MTELWAEQSRHPALYLGRAWLQTSKGKASAGGCDPREGDWAEFSGPQSPSLGAAPFGAASPEPLSRNGNRRRGEAGGLLFNHDLHASFVVFLAAERSTEPASNRTLLYDVSQASDLLRDVAQLPTPAVRSAMRWRLR